MGGSANPHLTLSSPGAPAPGSDADIVLFDPEVMLAHGRALAREGCMSVPDLTGDVARADRLVVRGATSDDVATVATLVRANSTFSF